MSYRKGLLMYRAKSTVLFRSYLFALVLLLVSTTILLVSEAVSEEAPLPTMDESVAAAAADDNPTEMLHALEMLEALDSNSTAKNNPPEESHLAEESFDSNDDKTLFGDNNLRDHYEVDGIMGTWGDAVCAFVPRDMMEWNGENWEIVQNGVYDKRTIELFDPSSAFHMPQDQPLCAEEPFIGQATLPVCSGFLVGPQMIATAAHCVKEPGSLGAFRIVFGFVQQSSTPGDFPKLYPGTHVYEAARMVKFGFNQEVGIDFALIELDRPEEMPCVWPLPIRHEGAITTGTQVGVIGYPQGLTRKYTFGNEITVQNVFDNHFIANIDSYQGNSGSPVINPATGIVEGVLMMGPTQEYTASSNNFTPNPTVDPCTNDIVPPEIILVGSGSMDLVLCASDPLPTLPGATAWDACEGNLTANITVTGEVSPAPGVYTLTYTVSDSKGNAALPVQRTITVEAPDGPYIYVPSRIVEAPCGRLGSAEIPVGELRESCSGAVLQTIIPRMDTTLIKFTFLFYEHADAQTAVGYVSNFPQNPPVIEVMEVINGAQRTGFVLGQKFTENNAQVVDAHPFNTRMLPQTGRLTPLGLSPPRQDPIR